MELFKEHLGLLNCASTTIDSNHDEEDYIGVDGYRNMKREDAVVMDPLHDEFYFDIWDKTAEKNTLIYRDVFKCVPDDTGK
jgi:predicted ester cyclase